MHKCGLISNEEGVISEISYRVKPHGLSIELSKFSFESKEDKKRKERLQSLATLIPNKT